MRAPSKAPDYRLVEIQSGQRGVISSELNLTSRANKLGEAQGRDVLGCNKRECIEPRNSNIVADDEAHGTESSIGLVRYASTGTSPGVCDSCTM